ncbi:MAG: transposase [Elainellaceae cyanobacterium]
MDSPTLMLLFRPLFSHSAWRSAMVLVSGAVLAPGKRTVSAALRVIGLAGVPNYQTYHRVLNRAVWSSRNAMPELATLVAPPNRTAATPAWGGVALVLVFILGCGILLSEPAIAATCRDAGNHRICLIDVQRSAKNYWEYRAAVSVDGDRRPVEVYDCRAKKRTTVDGKRIPFEVDGAGELICRLLHH